MGNRISLKTILIIGKHWPEPASSAAGSRMIQLIEALSHLGQINFASAAAASVHSADLEKWNVRCEIIRLNDSEFDAFIQNLQPDLVIFDRFMTEEQFGWRVTQNCPDAIRILDTEDLHGLRNARQRAVEENRLFSEVDLMNEVAIREIAAIYRCDLSLIISEVEIEILEQVYSVPKNLLLYIPFMIPASDNDSSTQASDFDERRDFVTIGNFLHAPNTDAVLFLEKLIWPKIRQLLPEVNMHVYGAYLPKNIENLHNPKAGFLVHGRAVYAEEMKKTARVFLASLRFGAGLKGKLITAMQCGTPSVTTSVGAEGMHGQLDWCGVVADSEEDFARAAVDLYTDRLRWSAAGIRGAEILKTCFNADVHRERLTRKLEDLRENIAAHRRNNFTGAILQHHSMRSTEYMSRWIEMKSKLK